MISNTLFMMATGFGLGLIHALDADHVMAVSALNSQKPSVIKTLGLSANWALGHAGVLFLCGMLLFGLGLSLPQLIMYWSELIVGVMLIVLGLFLFRRLQQQNLSLVTHRHGDIVHLHWHVKDKNEQRTIEDSHTHAPVIVGMLHGLAGSAPVLALVPALVQDKMSLALFYLVLFSFGLMIAMLMFGLGLGYVQQKLKKIHLKLFTISRYLIALTSVVIGGFWITQTI